MCTHVSCFTLLRMRQRCLPVSLCVCLGTRACSDAEPAYPNSDSRTARHAAPSHPIPSHPIPSHYPIPCRWTAPLGIACHGLHAQSNAQCLRLSRMWQLKWAVRCAHRRQRMRLTSKAAASPLKRMKVQTLNRVARAARACGAAVAL